MKLRNMLLSIPNHVHVFTNMLCVMIVTKQYAKGGFFMPTCENCHRTWSWKQTIQKNFSLDPAMECSYCGTKQYHTPKSKVKNGLLNFIILLPLVLNIFFDIPWMILLSLFPILFVVVLSIYPFFMELSSKDEYFNLFKT